MHGRRTKVPNTTRIDTIWPEEWPILSKKQKIKGGCSAGRQNMSDCKKLSEKRSLRQFIRRYLNVISEGRAKVVGCEGPSMPWSPKAECSEKGYVPEFHYGMVHEPIAVKRFDERSGHQRRSRQDKLKSLRAWDFKKVKP